SALPRLHGRPHGVPLIAPAGDDADMGEGPQPGLDRRAELEEVAGLRVQLRSPVAPPVPADRGLRGFAAVIATGQVERRHLAAQRLAEPGRREFADRLADQPLAGGGDGAGAAPDPDATHPLFGRRCSLEALDMFPLVLQGCLALPRPVLEEGARL